MASHKPAPKQSTSRISHDEISRRARELWESRGQPLGQDDEIWLQAERELTRNPGPGYGAAGTEPSVRTAVEPKPTGRLPRRGEADEPRSGRGPESGPGRREPDDESDV